MSEISLKDRFLGCFLGGAVGDALGAPVEFQSLHSICSQYGDEGIRDFASAFGKIGAFTDDTQMALFTTEGLIRAVKRFEDRGICHPPTIVYHAYLRWLNTQGHRTQSESIQWATGGWLSGTRELNEPRAPGNSCLTALMSHRMGTMDEPINNSKGCGGVMRIAPVGLALSLDDPFENGCEIAAITHGHPSGYLASGFLALVIRMLANGEELQTAIDMAIIELKNWKDHEECLNAIQSALRLAENAEGTPEDVETLGQGWIAEEALAISLFCSLVAEDFERGVILAVNHSGDSDSTGAITGNILGTMYGVSSIPDRWLRRVELREVIEELAEDFFKCFGEDKGEELDFEKYPPW